MQPPPTLQTRRLLLQPLQLSDAPAIQQHFAHWEVVRYLNALVPCPIQPMELWVIYAMWRCPPLHAAKNGTGLFACSRSRTN